MPDAPTFFRTYLQIEVLSKDAGYFPKSLMEIACDLEAARDSSSVLGDYSVTDVTQISPADCDKACRERGFDLSYFTDDQALLDSVRIPDDPPIEEKIPAQLE